MPWPANVPIGTRVTKQFGESWFSGTVTGYHSGDPSGRKHPTCV
jgi:hypothetical protein